MAFAEAGCVLRVDVRCDQCKYKILEVLSSIIGVYNVNMDGEEGLVMISGEVDPNILLKALARTGRHAQLVRVNFRHPQWSRPGQSYGYSALDGPFGYGYSNRSCLPDYSYPANCFPGMLNSLRPDYPFRRTYGCWLPPRHPLVFARRPFGPTYYGSNPCSFCL